VIGRPRKTIWLRLRLGPAARRRGLLAVCA
jgi:hypothetical protein